MRILLGIFIPLIRLTSFSLPLKFFLIPTHLIQSTGTSATSEPTTSVMILQDTDVTITGMYVNSSVGASQESYCKMQYRVQSSVTEERVLRHNSQSEPPKCYTPLSALSSMRPPVQPQDQQPPVTGIVQPPAIHPLELTGEPNMTEYHRGDPAGLGLKDYGHHVPEYSPYGPPHPSMYHHGLGGHPPPPPQHMMGPGPSTSAFCAPPPTSAAGPGQHDLGGKCRNFGGCCEIGSQGFPR